jgi:hypothetical protein
VAAGERPVELPHPDEEADRLDDRSGGASQAGLRHTPAAPLDRLLAAGVLSHAQEAELRARRDRLNPADLSRRIQTLQDRLTALARDATLALQAATKKPLPDTTRGISLRPAS